jgi:hypothetical protein
MSKARYTVEAILRELDACAQVLSFPMLDNGYIYLGDTRFSAYANEFRWAILFEVLGFHYKEGIPTGISTNLFLCGNGIPREAYAVGTVGGLTIDLTPEQHEEYWYAIPSTQDAVTIRGQSVLVPRDPAIYAAKGIVLDDSLVLHGQDLMRVLLPEHREAMLATEEERRRVIPPKLPLFAQLNEWHHPRVIRELPSECSTFQNLAAAMVAMEPNMFRLTEEPNTHWRNWPEGGTL